MCRSLGASPVGGIVLLGWRHDVRPEGGPAGGAAALVGSGVNAAGGVAVGTSVGSGVGLAGGISMVIKTFETLLRGSSLSLLVTNVTPLLPPSEVACALTRA